MSRRRAATHDIAFGANGTSQLTPSSSHSTSASTLLASDLHSEISRYADSVGMHEWSLAMEFYDYEDLQKQYSKTKTRTGIVLEKEEYQILVIEREGMLQLATQRSEKRRRRKMLVTLLLHRF